MDEKFMDDKFMDDKSRSNTFGALSMLTYNSLNDGIDPNLIICVVSVHWLSLSLSIEHCAYSSEE